MDILSTHPVDPRHPSWCDVNGSCTAPAALEARGVAEADVPPAMQQQHMSKPIRVPAGQFGDVDLEVFAWQDINQPPTGEVEAVQIICSWPYQTLTVGVPVSRVQLPHLAEALADVVRLVRPTGLPGTPAENPIVEDVARSLRIIGCVTRDNAAALLSLCTVQLTDREDLAVLDRFPVDGVQA